MNTENSCKQSAVMFETPGRIGGQMLTRSQSLPVGIFIANLKRGDWNEKKESPSPPLLLLCNKNTNRKRLGTSQGQMHK